MVDSGKLPSKASRKRILITRRLPEKAMALLRELTNLNFELDVWDFDEPIPREEFLKRVVGITGLYCLLTDKVDSQVLDSAGNCLKVISTMSVGYDHIDTQQLKQRGITLGHTPDVLTDATADLTLSLLLATSRRLFEAAEEVKSGGWGTWKPFWMCGTTLRGSTVGIVGLGRIGIAVAKRLVVFGVSKFLYTGRSAKPVEARTVNAEFVDLNTLLQNSDYVIACCALNSDTKEMFNNKTFSQMKPSAIFINTSRGGIVNQNDLYKCLRDGKIKAAGLDVTTPEPLPTDHALLSLPNCVVLPHIGSAEETTRTDMAVLAARNLLAGLKGQELPAKARL